MNASQWDDLYQLAAESNTSFIFGTAFDLQKACDAGANYTWNSTNAATLLEQVVAHVYPFLARGVGERTSLSTQG
jgi:hypothetical protein